MTADAELTERDEAFPAWDDVPDKLKAFYARQMEVYAGFSENADHNAGRVIDAIDELGELDDTVVIWIWGDNGASIEGTVTGSFNEMTMQNGIPLTDEMQLQLAERFGGLDKWGAPDHGPALRGRVGLGGERAVQVGQAGGLAPGRHPQPDGRRWPERINNAGGFALAVRSRDRRRTDDPRHRRDPATANGRQDQRRSPCTGPASRQRSPSATAPEFRTQQYFETIGNRGMYKDGWWLAMKTERIPWVVTAGSAEAVRAGRLGSRCRSRRAVLPAR